MIYEAKVNNNFNFHEFFDYVINHEKEKNQEYLLHKTTFCFKKFDRTNLTPKQIVQILHEKEFEQINWGYEVEDLWINGWMKI